MRSWRWPLLAIVLLIAGVAIARSALDRAKPELHDYGLLPEFHLVDQDGRAFGNAEMRGRVWVADFVFLGCSDVCPRLTARMAELAGQLDGGIRLVTFSVDPSNDTPERLRAYAAAYGADPRRWTFVTGPADEVEHTVVRGFKIAMGKEPAPAADGRTEILTIFHGEKFVLVDREGRIRGYYDADPEGLARIAAAAHALDD